MQTSSLQSNQSSIASQARQLTPFCGAEPKHRLSQHLQRHTQSPSTIPACEAGAPLGFQRDGSFPVWGALQKWRTGGNADDAKAARKLLSSEAKPLSATVNKPQPMRAPRNPCRSATLTPSLRAFPPKSRPNGGASHRTARSGERAPPSSAHPSPRNRETHGTGRAAAPPNWPSVFPHSPRARPRLQLPARLFLPLSSLSRPPSSSQLFATQPKPHHQSSPPHVLTLFFCTSIPSGSCWNNPSCYSRVARGKRNLP